MQTVVSDITKYISVLKDYRVIKSSGMFDATWYAQTYPDVLLTRLAPLWHYVCIGAFNGYKPNSDFDSKWYLSQYPDVSAAGINPLVHYIVAGQFESRRVQATPVTPSPVPEVHVPEILPASWSIRDRVAHIVSSAVYNDYPTYTPQDTFNAPDWNLSNKTTQRRPESYYQQVFRDAMGRFDAQYDVSALNKVYDTLSDLYSREMFVYVLVGRLLGATKYRLPIHFSHVWRMYPLVAQCGDNSTKVMRDNITLYMYDLNPIGHDLRMFSATMGVFIGFILEQYKYADIVSVKPGDIVIDGGAFLGETALYFAERVGLNGQVYAFEFMPANVEFIHKNLAMNSKYQSVVEIVERPLWSDSAMQLSADDRGPGTSLRTANDSDIQTFTTISIDDFVKLHTLDRVDFIKLDIEGAELATIEGARAVITAYKPQLAICIYHKNSDFWQIPLLLHEMVPEYEFYVDHFVPFPNWETVLFARVRS
jgi:FkbM family methyltransferase